RCCSVNVDALLTSTMTFTIRLTLLRSPSAACRVPTRSMATERAAFCPSSVVTSLPSCPVHGLPSRFAIWPERYTRLPVRRNGTKAATGGVTSGRTIFRAFRASYTDMRNLQHFYSRYSTTETQRTQSLNREDPRYTIERHG